MLTYDPNDLHSFALCVWKEARGEGHDGMQAVAEVIRNRAIAWYRHSPHPLHDAIYAKNQFTSMSVPSDPEFHLLPGDDPLFLSCYEMCTDILTFKLHDFVPGALYYFNPRTANSTWFTTHVSGDHVNHPLVATIGKQEFFR